MSSYLWPWATDTLKSKCWPVKNIFKKPGPRERESVCYRLFTISEHEFWTGAQERFMCSVFGSNHEMDDGVMYRYLMEVSLLSSYFTLPRESLVYLRQKYYACLTSEYLKLIVPNVNNATRLCSEGYAD